MSLFNNIQGDMARYTGSERWFKSLGFWVSLVYRFGSWASGLRPKFLGLPFRVVYVMLAIPCRIFLHVYLPARTVIGPGLYLPHPYLIMIPPESIFGSDCTIYHNVTLGHCVNPGVPQLADNVVIFSGAKVLGGVSLGEHAHIGVNTVVMRDVGPGLMVTVPLCRSIPMRKDSLLSSKNKG